MRALFCVFLLHCLLLAPAARANEVDVSARLKVLAGKSRPAVLVTVNRAVRRIELHLQRDDGKRIIKTLKRPRLGKLYALEFAQPVGTQHYQGELIVVFGPNNEASMPLSFDVEVKSGAFRIEMTNQDLDLAARTAQVRVGCEVDKLSVEIDGEDGVLARFDTEHHSAPANTPLSFHWRTPGHVLRIVVKPLCSDGVFREQYFYPWSYPVEHEEVLFASGSHQIPADQSGKLDASLAAIQKALAKYGKWGKPALWIAGHTDTVAGKTYNRDLSARRARSIARYFKRKGLHVDVHYIGFGEEALLVKTPDNTPEPRNRRAEYLIAVNEPDVDVAGFSGAWRKL